MKGRVTTIAGVLAGLAGIALAASVAVGQAAAPPQARVSYHSETGKVRFLGTDPGRPIERPPGIAADAPPQVAARAFLAAQGSLFGIDNAAQDLDATSAETRRDGRSVVRYQQLHRGVPVVGGELVVQLDDQRNVLVATGEILPDVDLDVAARITPAAARESAIAVVAKTYRLSAGDLTATAPQLWIYDPRLLGGPGLPRPTLVWRLDVRSPGAGAVRELVLVDARLGAVVVHFNQVGAAKNRTTYTANNTTTLPGTLKCSEAGPFPACATGDADTIGAHQYAGDTYDFYFTRHGRDSFDDAGGALISSVHYSVNYLNAFWNGTQMVYGDAATFARADDVVAHELTHGVTDRESRLFYYYQSGAINESLSDVWGELVDLTNGLGNDTPGVRWLMGEDVSPGGAIRNMKDPGAFGDPDRMTSPQYFGGETDNGGVHTNSGVNNKAAYLMVDGDTFNGKTVAALGIDKTADIYYEVQTNLLTSAGDYQDLYDLLQQACTTLIGTGGITSGDCGEVRDAVDAVEMNTVPPAATTVDAPVCPPGQSPANLFFDNLENTASGNWASSQLVGTNNWYYPPTANPYGFDATYATSGVTNFWGYDLDSISDSVMAQTSSVVLPAGTSYLHFKHAYGFENTGTTYYDGGVVEYSTNGGATWSDAGTLFTEGGYRGPIQSGFGNPLAGRQGFVGQSNGYGSSRLNLTPLAGQSVRFRFRIGTDNVADDFGWFVDDIRIYTCAAAPSAPTFGDFDGDGDADLAVYRPSDGVWYVKGQPPFAAWGGLVGDVAVPADYDGDGDFDVAIYRPSDGIWYVKGQVSWGQWGGVAGDVPVPGDYDGDGDADLAVFRPSSNTWFVKDQFSLVLGQAGDVPVPADYDGDGSTDPAVFRPSSGSWVIDGLPTVSGWGAPGDVPVPVDFDGDGDADVAVYRPSDGVWYVKDQPPFMRWGGLAGDVPAPANFDGVGGTAEITTYRPSDGLWYVKTQVVWDQWGGQPNDVVLIVPPAVWLEYFA